MREAVLVTGGCGFIGRHVCEELLERGCRVRILDALIDQVHGSANGAARPALRDAEVIRGDVCDADAVRDALAGVDSVIHLAAEVGVGQSMYEVARYVGGNDLGTAVLMETLLRRPVRRVVVASSMSVYGEGLYRDADGRIVGGAVRGATPGRWDPLDAAGRPLHPVATPETKPVSLSSVYALTKYVQERLTLIVAGAYGMEGCALRLFNVFGPGQALSNPYTGVLAIFASRLVNGEAPLVFEDGRQRRDFVHVKDVAHAFALALERPQAAGQVINIGSGEDRTILSVATDLAAAMGVPDIEPQVLGKARAGDIRHCFADISEAQRLLGFSPARRLDRAALAELAEWVASVGGTDNISRAHRELETRGLLS